MCWRAAAFDAQQDRATTGCLGFLDDIGETGCCAHRLVVCRYDDITTTQTNLRTQANKLTGLAGRVGEAAIALNGIEEARGIVRSADLSDALQRATKRAVNRLLTVESQSNARANSAPLGLNGKTSIADIVGTLTNASSPGSAIVSALGKSLRGGNAKPTTPESIFATAATFNTQLGDIFGRALPTLVEAMGRADVEVKRRALEAKAGEVVIDPNDPAAVLPTVRVTDAGRASRSNEGFALRARTGDKGGTVVLPADGLGTGLSMLPQKAPKIFIALEERLAALAAL